MTSREITQSNILIAEFMGLKCKYEDNIAYWYSSSESEKYAYKVCRNSQLQYSLSLDWLMPVVSRIEAISNGSFDICRWEVKVAWWYHDDLHRMGYDRISKWNSIGGIHHEYRISCYPESEEKLTAITKSDAIYNACILFIEWYNKNKK